MASRVKFKTRCLFAMATQHFNLFGLKVVVEAKSKARVVLLKALSGCIHKRIR